MRDTIHKTKYSIRRIFGIGYFVFGIFLSSCVSPTATVTPTLEIPAGGTPTPTSVLANTTPGPVSTSDSNGQVLRLWLPPQFAPDEDTPGGRALLAQWAAFEEAKGWRVEVRVKKAAGQGGLLDHLRTSLQVAPAVSPDVIALDSAMLESAANFIQPLTGLTDADLDDYYGFAITKARVDEQLVGLPFAADALGFAYSTTNYPLPPQSWADFAPEQGVVWLPLSDPSALITLQQYIAVGGTFTDRDGKLALDARLLAQVLGDYQAMQIAGLLPTESFSAASVDVSWMTYRESRAAAAAASFSTYLVDRRRVAATAFTFIPSHAGRRATFARQWNYALVATDPSRQALALELMRWLTAPDNLGAWTMAANVLPPRAQALTAWSDTGLASVADQLLSAAQPEPSQSVLAIVGPPVTAAVQSVLNGQASPETAAATAAAVVAGR